MRLLHLSLTHHCPPLSLCKSFQFHSRWAAVPEPWRWWWCCAGVRSDTVPWEPQTHFLYNNYTYGKMLGMIICGPEWLKKKKKTHLTEWYGAALQGENILKANIYKQFGWSWPCRSQDCFLINHGTCVATTYLTVCWWWKIKVYLWGHSSQTRIYSFQTGDPSLHILCTNTKICNYDCSHHSYLYILYTA